MLSGDLIIPTPFIFGGILAFIITVITIIRAFLIGLLSNYCYGEQTQPGEKSVIKQHFRCKGQA